MNRASRSIMIGSRGSQLALWQSNWVRSELLRYTPAMEITIETISTTGDKILDSPLAKIGDKGLFTKEIEHALFDRSIDLAVHSLKDVPTKLPEGLTLAAVTVREDVRDVFISHPHKHHACVDDIPQGGTIATGSLRRTSQLLSWRPDIHIVNLRGNLNTRFAKLDASDWDGMLLARAGVIRLGFEKRITEVIPLERMLPAVGQGALGIECRADDDELIRMLQQLASSATTSATGGERSLLRRLEGGCQIPIGTFGRIENNVFHLDAVIGSLDGKKTVRGKIHGEPSESEELGVRLAEILLKSGGREILEQIRTIQPGQPGQPGEQGETGSSPGV